MDTIYPKLSGDLQGIYSMPKCAKCGKRLSSLQALNDHFRSVHPNEKFVVPKQASGARTLITIIIIVIIVMGGMVSFLVYNEFKNPSTTTTYSVCTDCIHQQIPIALYDNLTGVSPSILSAIGSGSGVTAPSKISGSLLTNDGKPEVLYIGGEYCPYCAAERWPMIVALSQFGTFSNISLMLSSATDFSPDTATFSFVNSSYTSPYISFVSVEYEDRNQQPLQSISSTQQSLWSQYDSSGSIPFLDIGNQYRVVGSQFEPYALHVGDVSSGTTAPYNWTQIGTQLTNTNSLISKQILGSANTLITAICNIITQSGQSPPNVCSQSFAKLSIAITPGISEGSPILSVVVPNRPEIPS